MTSPTQHRYRVYVHTWDRFTCAFEAESAEDAIEQAKTELYSTGTMGFEHVAREFGGYDARLIEEGVKS